MSLYARPSVIRLFTCLAVLVLSAERTLQADLTLRPAGEHGVRITLATDETNIALNPGFVDQKLPEPAARVKSGETVSKQKIGQLLVSVTANPLKVRVEDAAGRVIQDLEFAESGESIFFQLDDAPILGLGAGAQQFDRRGTIYQVRNGQVSGLPNKNGQMEGLATLGGRIHVPFLLGTSGWALYISAPLGEVDLRGQRGEFKPQRGFTPGFADILVVDAREPARAMREYMRLTGAAAMPPKWALGYMQSHRTLTKEADVLAEARMFREKKLPCDAMIYLGTGFCPDGWNLGHDSYEINNRVFERDLKAVVKDLHDLNFRVSLHIVPQSPQNRHIYPTLHGTIPPAAGEAVDTFSISEYWKRHKPLIDAGVDGWWPDEGDWLDVPSRVARHRMYYDGPLSDLPNVRPWNLQRNGYAGIARTGGWFWSGDIQSTWKTLSEHVKIGQNASMSVSPFWGTDIGGFWPSRANEYTGELYTRWFQFASFNPSFRSHGRNWRLHTPYGWNQGEPEWFIEARPLPAAAEFRNAEVEPICREYLNLRYQLMPYTYTITREARDTGMPLMRALWLHYPTDPTAIERGDQFMWGRDLLVAPVVERGASSREVYLPKGDWYDWWTGEKAAGGRAITRNVDLKIMPLYVRAGAIIPFDPVRQYVDEPVTEPTTIRVYRGADGQFVLYEDDGKSLDYEKGAGTWTSFAWNDAQRTLKIALDGRTRDKPAARELDVVLLPDNQHKKVTFSGTPVEVKF